MKYRVIQVLKTKLKTMGIFDTLEEAHQFLESIGATFRDISYYGGNPMYRKGDKNFEINGFVRGMNCSLDSSETTNFYKDKYANTNEHSEA